MQTTRLSYSSRFCCLAPKANSISSQILLFALTIFMALSFISSAFALDLPDYELSYEKSSGKVIGIVNKTASRESKPLVIKAPITSRKFDPKEVESLTIQFSDKFLIEKGSLLGIKNVASELFPKGFNEDNLGIKVIRYEQRLNGVPVYGSEIVTQVNSNYEVLSTSGRLISGLKINTDPKVSASKAIKIAKKDMEKRYGWRSALSVAKRDARKNCRDDVEPSICVGKHIRKFNKSNGFYSNKPPQLVIYSEDFVSGRDVASGDLAWKLYIMNDFGDSEEYFVEALNGLIIKAQETKHHDTYRRVFDCSNFLGDGLCYSQKSSPAYPGYIFGRKGDAPVRGPNPVPGPLFGSTDVDETFDIIPHIHNYYQSKFNRNGGNNFGGIGDVFCPSGNCTAGSGPAYVDETHIYVNINGTTPENCEIFPAFFQWNPPGINFCRDTVSLDVFGHEYAHSVAWFDSYNPDENKFYSVLRGGGQSGALNESNSDITGVAFRFYVTGSIDWLIGADALGVLNVSLSDPPSTTFMTSGGPLPFPDRFNSPDFYCGSGNNGGMHINSTVPSKAAYLATDGGTFNGCTIQGIGLDKVEQIWYRALTSYYTETTTFNQAFLALNLACSDFANANMHGITTFDCEQVNAALQAVEMDQGGFCSGIPAVTPECASQTITPTATATATATSTATVTNTPTQTATNTATNTATATNTPTNTATNTSTATNTQTATATNTLTPTATNTATQTATNTSTFPNDPVVTNTPVPTVENTPTNEATIVSVPTETPPAACVSTAQKPDVKVKGKNATLKISAIKSNTYKFFAKPSAGKTLSKSIKAVKNGKLSHTFKKLKEGQWDFSYSVKVKKVTTTSCPVQASIAAGVRRK